MWKCHWKGKIGMDNLYQCPNHKWRVGSFWSHWGCRLCWTAFCRALHLIWHIYRKCIPCYWPKCLNHRIIGSRCWPIFPRSPSRSNVCCYLDCCFHTFSNSKIGFCFAHRCCNYTLLFFYYWTLLLYRQSKRSAW